MVWCDLPPRQGFFGLVCLFLAEDWPSPPFLARRKNSASPEETMPIQEKPCQSEKNQANGPGPENSPDWPDFFPSLAEFSGKWPSFLGLAEFLLAEDWPRPPLLARRKKLGQAKRKLGQAKRKLGQANKKLGRPRTGRGLHSWLAGKSQANPKKSGQSN